MQPTPLFAAVIGGAAVFAWRLRETKTPVTARKILVPPVAMSTGFCMFLAPEARVPLPWALSALAAGALLFSYPLIRTSELVRTGDLVMLQRSRWFLVILLGLLAIRLAGRAYVEQYVDVLQTGSLFFLLAFGMLAPWRVAMYLRFRALRGAVPPA